jgi:putative transposase
MDVSQPSGGLPSSLGDATVGNEVTKSYRIRAYPNAAQMRMLDIWFGAVRWLWNVALGIRSAAYRVLGLRLTGQDLSAWLTQWKRTPGHEWLAQVPATCLTQCLRDLEKPGSFCPCRAGN